MIVNLMEQHVREGFERLRHVIPGFPDSQADQEDVVVYALNRLPPKYVITVAGQAVTNVALNGDQFRATIDVQIIEAMRLVMARPRAEHLNPSG